MLGRRRRGGGDGRGGAAGEPFAGLRRVALGAHAAGALAGPYPGHPDVAGVVVDVPLDGRWATLVALADGTASMYTSTGGGVIGAGTHQPVARAIAQLLVTAQAHATLVAGADDGGLPAPDAVRFHLLRPDGRSHTVDVAVRAFWGADHQHPLLPLIGATQAFLTAISQV